MYESLRKSKLRKSPRKDGITEEIIKKKRANNENKNLTHCIKNYK